MLLIASRRFLSLRLKYIFFKKKVNLKYEELSSRFRERRGLPYEALREVRWRELSALPTFRSSKLSESIRLLNK